MKHTLQQVSRFLMQATLGADQKLIDSVSQQGIEKWLANEFKSTPSLGHSYESTTRETGTISEASSLMPMGKER